MRTCVDTNYENNNYTERPLTFFPSFNYHAPRTIGSALWLGENNVNFPLVRLENLEKRSKGANARKYNISDTNSKYFQMVKICAFGGRNLVFCTPWKGRRVKACHFNENKFTMYTTTPCVTSKKFWLQCLHYIGLLCVIAEDLVKYFPDTPSSWRRGVFWRVPCKYKSENEIQNF